MLPPRSIAFCSLTSVFLLLNVASCQRSAPAETTSSKAGSEKPKTECIRVAADRARVATLRAEGRLDRIARILAQADEVCPQDAPATWATRLNVLAELGKADEVNRLANEIDGARQAPPEARDAARTARETIAAQAKNPPNGPELVQAGLAAKSKGDLPAAQRFFDRALAALEKHPAKAVRLATPGAFDGSMALSTDGQKMALSTSGLVSLRDQKIGYLETARITDLTSDILDLDFSRDGTMLATGHRDGSVRIFNAQTGEIRHVFKGHTDEIADIEFAPDGQTLASGAADTTIRLWNVQTGVQIRALEGSSDPISYLKFSSNGSMLAAANLANVVHWWNPSSGEHIRNVNVASDSTPISHLAFSADDKNLVTGMSTETITSWPIASNTPKLKHSALLADNPQDEAGPLPLVAFSADAKRVVTIGRQMIVWDVATTKKIKEISITSDDPPNQVLFSRDGSTMAIRTAGTSVRLLNTSTWKEIASVRSLAASSSFVSGVVFGDRGKTLAVSAADKTIRVWSAKVGEELRTIERESSTTPFIAISPDGSLIATPESWSGSGYGARVVRRADGKEVGKLNDLSSSPEGVAFSPDGKTVFVALSYGLLEWNPTSGAVTKKLPRVYASGYRFAFAPDRSAIFYDGAPRRSELWDIATEKKRFDMVGHSGEIRAVAYSPRGDVVASGATDKTVNLWSTTDGTLLRSLEGFGGSIRTMCFTPDGKTIVAAGDDEIIRRFNTDTGAELETVKETPASALACSSQAIAWSSKDDVIRVSKVGDERRVLLRVFPGRDAGYVQMDQAIEFVGSDKEAQGAMISCLAGSIVYPIDLCRERYETKGLLLGILGAE
jgi:WD40 repeat protein